MIKEYPNAKLVLTGHSLGGAVATLAAIDFAHKNIHVDRTIVFGAPRVGNARFAEYGASKIPNYIVYI